MKFRPALLILGAVLIATVPVLADGIPQQGRAEQSFSISLFNRFGSNNSVHVVDSKSSIGMDSVFSRSSKADVNSASLIDLGPNGRDFSVSHTEKTWSEENPDNEWNGHPVGDSPGPMHVPEPGSFSLLLLGLAGVGLLGYGSTAWTKTKQAR